LQNHPRYKPFQSKFILTEFALAAHTRRVDLIVALAELVLEEQVSCHISIWEPCTS
jgi:hypothetical protein